MPAFRATGAPGLRRRPIAELSVSGPGSEESLPNSATGGASGGYDDPVSKEDSLSKKNKSAAPATTGRRIKRRRGFLRRSLGRLVVVSAVSAAARFLADAGNRKKILGIVGR